jgi:CHAT domain-containing protein
VLARTLRDRTIEAITLHHISSLFEKSQPDLAILFGKQCVNILQTIRRDNHDLDEPLRKSFERTIEFKYRYLAGLLIDRERFGEAEEVLNLLKDREAADFIRRDAVADQLKPATLLDSERRALDRYEQIVTRIVSEGQAKSALVAKAAKSPLTGEEQQRSRQLDSDLAAASAVLLRFFLEQEKTVTGSSGSAQRIEDLKESEGLQDTLRLLGPDVVAIYTLVLPEKYTAVLITSGARKAYSTAIPEEELNRKVFEFRQLLQNPLSDPLPLAQQLYSIIFPEGLRRDLDEIGAKTVMWSIDGTPRYVPFAALHDGKQYLVARFRNSLITNATLSRLSLSSQAVWKGVGFGVSQPTGSFSALPAVPEELRRIFRQGESGDAPVPGRVRLDREFTRDAFEAAMRQPDKLVVHIATHFDSQPEAAKSRLLLGDGTEMSLAEIEAMPLLFSGVDLLTLSACSTAFSNRSEDGREVDSFGTIAQRLGARGVIASLWSVTDDATARLMETMYRLRQASPELGKSEALRQAQEQMMAGVLNPGSDDTSARGIQLQEAHRQAIGWQHPYYWAPFILIGNWK